MKRKEEKLITAENERISKEILLTNQEKCKFFTERRAYNCNALMHTKCDGTKKDCRFYKTEEQFDKESDRAILINRSKGNCEKCRYRLIHCELSCE